MAVLVKAASSDDVPALLKLFGPDGEDLVSSADPVRDKGALKAFVAKADQKRKVQEGSAGRRRGPYALHAVAAGVGYDDRSE